MSIYLFLDGSLFASFRALFAETSTLFASVSLTLFPGFSICRHQAAICNFPVSICRKLPSICKTANLFATFPTQFAKFTFDKFRVVPVTEGRGDRFHVPNVLGSSGDFIELPY